MPKKFGALTGAIEKTAKVIILDPATGQSITDTNGREAYIEVDYADSHVGRNFDKEQRQAARNSEEQMERNKAKTARLTRSWLLVDPVTHEALDVPCTEDNALELFNDPSPIANNIWMQAWLGANSLANFIKRGSANSTDTPSTTSANPAG